MSTGSPGLYLLIGKERFLKKEFIDELRGRLFPGGAGADLNTQEFGAEQGPLSGLLDFLNTIPFAAQNRLAVFWNVDALDPESQAQLLKALDRLLPSSVCVLESEQTNAKKNLFLNKLAQKGKLVACHAPFERDLPAWVQQRAKKIGLTLDAKVVSFLIDCSGQEVSVLASSLQQLAAFIHPKTNALLSDAELLFQKKATDDVYLLAELLMDQKTAQALRVLDALFREGSRGPEIVAALASQIDRWKKGTARLAQGRSLDEIGLELKIPQFFQASFFGRLKRLPPERLPRMAQLLLECDESVKSGRVPERPALERFILQS